MANRYEDERRWRRRGEGRSDWEDEAERDWEDYQWRNRPYSRREDMDYYREQDWRSRQGRMRPRYGEGYGMEYGRPGYEYGPGYDREREWRRGRDLGWDQDVSRGGGYGASSRQGFGRGEQTWRGGQGSRPYDYGEEEWERERRQPRGRYGREFDREEDWGYGRRRTGYGGGYGRDFDRYQDRYGGGYGRGFDRYEDRYGRGQFGQYDRFRDEEDYDWEEEGEPITSWTYTEYWFVPGPYAGIGPRDYRRSDDRIFEEVCDRLTQHGQIDASDIEVDVQNGEVTLRGSVADRREKRLAEDLAESIFGVSDVQNQLRARERQLGRIEEIRHEPERMTGRETRTGTQGRTGTRISAMNRDQIRQGMEVVGRDGERVGEVKEVRSDDFLVDRSMARDVYIPFSASSMSKGRIMLDIRADEVNNQDWETSDILSGEESEQQRRNR